MFVQVRGAPPENLATFNKQVLLSLPDRHAPLQGLLSSALAGERCFWNGSESSVGILLTGANGKSMAFVHRFTVG